jgi:PHP family Zn ribbon phosphoesterase
VPFKNVIPLEEIIAETFGVGVGSKKVQVMYESMVYNPSQPPLTLRGGAAGLPPLKVRGDSLPHRLPRAGRGSYYNEFQILLDLSKEQITEISDSAIADAIIRVREGKVKWDAGYDGIFGKIHIYEEKEREALLKKSEQVSLF